MEDSIRLVKSIQKKNSARESSHVKRLGSVRPGWSITELKKYSQSPSWARFDIAIAAVRIIPLNLETRYFTPWTSQTGQITLITNPIRSGFDPIWHTHGANVSNLRKKQKKNMGPTCHIYRIFASLLSLCRCWLVLRGQRAVRRALQGSEQR